jgi:hypothetical protein
VLIVCGQLNFHSPRHFHKNRLEPKPWLQFPDSVMGDIEKVVASLFLNIMNAFDFNSWIFINIMGPILKALIPYFIQDPGTNPDQYTFWDVWYLGLPMDNRSDPDTLFSSFWCEIWVGTCSSFPNSLCT